MQRQFCLAGARFCNHPKKVYLHVCPQAQDVFKVCLLRFFFRINSLLICGVSSGWGGFGRGWVGC